MSTPNFKNIQGDIYPGLPKKTETFLFFRIGRDVSLFRKLLGQVIPHIKTSAGALADRKAIDDFKRRNYKDPRERLPLVGANISFSHAGLKKLSFEEVKDDLFVAGQKADAEALGDAGLKAADGSFVPSWEQAFLSTIDGVILVAGDSHPSVDAELLKITKILGPSIEEVKRIVGDVRPKENKGHEHFGYLDGISDPAVTGFDKTNLPGQEFIDANIIFTGSGGASSIQDGSLLAFRYLFQLVPEFDKFVNEASRGLFDGLGHKESADLFGARLVGRWKSGAPLDLAPLKDDPKLAANPHKNNNFRYAGELKDNDQARCPFSAHVRKTNPRADLEDANNAPTAPNRIIRRGIPFGPEVTGPEHQQSKTLHDRGLLFVSYQSILAKGFAFVQKSWANNPDFVQIFDKSVQTDQAGIDPIIGQKGSAARSFSGSNINKPAQQLSAPLWVLPKGGEYFFTPSISTLKNVLASGASVQKTDDL